jgi:signal transduction histidine kinase
MLTKIVDRIADKVRWRYFIAFILLLTSYLLTFYTTQGLLNQARLVNHTNRVLNNLDVLFSTVKDADFSFGEYVIVKDENFLDIYKKSEVSADSSVSALKLLIADNPSQLERLNTLSQLIKQKYSLVFTGISIFKNKNYRVTDSLKTISYESKEKMDEIKSLMLKMQDQENSLMLNRSEKLSSFSDFIKIVNIVSVVVAILLTFYSIVTFTKENRAKKEADFKAMQFRNQLELRVKELDNLNKELLELKSLEKFAVTGRISRTIAHEVRNPLTNINLAAEQIRSEIPSDPETDVLLDMVIRNGNRINQMISDLLNTTKVTELNFEKLSVNRLLDESLEFAQDRLELKRIKVVKNYTPDPCDILADAEKLKIAFLNIIVNAIEAMEENEGILDIKTEHKEERCVVTITDNGKGMDKEQLSKLFEPYFTTKENGTGLGLAHTQNIILSHKASIQAKSELGKGSSFSVALNYA